MKKNKPFLKWTSSRVSSTGIFLSLIMFLQAAVLTSTAQTLTFQQMLTKRSRDAYAYSDTAKRWLDWNILFHKNASDQDKEKCINYLKAKIEASISSHNNRTGENFHVDYHVVYCPCDSSLTNLNATQSIGSSGNSVPPKPPGTGGSGDLVSLNSPIDQDPRPEEKDSITNNKVPLTINSIDKSKLLAIMDTGLDPDLFGPDFTKLIWNDPGSNPTLRNFQFYHNRRPLEYMMDDDAHIHGTAVTTIALQEFEKAPGNTSNPKPMIMVLKVLDEQGKGNTFSLSCGLSYVVQKKATLVNASLGYYSNGTVDPILLHYVRLCNDVNPVPIPILAAAGNTRAPHDRFKLCDPSDNGNKLTKSNTFDPASFSRIIPNVISVTTLQNANTHCFYQNYSDEYVNVGVANGSSTGCCRFIVPFLNAGYEGSSFATPFISGKMMACLMAGGTIQSCRDQWSTAPVGSRLVTKDGKFVPNP